MISIKLTQRQREIIELLIKEDRFFTVSEIGKKMNVSNRTVSREIRDLDSYLDYFSCSIDSRSGKGIRFVGSEQSRGLLLENIKKSGEIKNYTQNQRIVYILTELLNASEPLKINNFTTELNVTEGTISHDLDKVSERLEKYGCKLVRKPGVGFYVDANESDKRRAIVDLIYENIEETELIDVIRNKDRLSVETRENLVNLISKNILYELEKLLIDNENKLKTTLNDRAYIGLLIHLAIAIDRINKGENIIIDKDYLNILKKCDEYIEAEKLSKAIGEKFNISMPEDEIGYITMHIIGNAGTKTSQIDDEIIKISSRILSNAYGELGLNVKIDRQSIIWLATHLQTALYRIRMNMEIRNPLLEEIKNNYTEIYKVAIKAVKPIEIELGTKIPDSEIAYIAMHIGASVERNRKNTIKYDVLVVCATGMGTATLLSTRLQNEYQNLNIVDVVSSLNIEEVLETNKDIDFIISTIPIDYGKIPLVVVNPLLLSNDKKLIDEFLKDFNIIDKAKETRAPRPIAKKDLNSLKDYLDAILEMLNNLFVVDILEVENLNLLIDHISNTIGRNDTEVSNIKEGLLKRESLGSTVLDQYNAILLHAKTTGVDRLIFGAIRLLKPIYIENDGNSSKIDLAIIMLAPKDINKNKLSVMSFLSSKIVEDENFLFTLRNSEKDMIHELLEDYLNEFYEKVHYEN